MHRSARTVWGLHTLYELSSSLALPSPICRESPSGGRGRGRTGHGRGVLSVKGSGNRSLFDFLPGYGTINCL